MTTSILKTALAAALAAVSITASAADADSNSRVVSISNVSDGVIWSVQISNIDSSSWGQDLLGSQVLQGQEFAFVEPAVINGYCRFDIRIVFADNAEYVLPDVNLCEVMDIEIDNFGYANLIR